MWKVVVSEGDEVEEGQLLCIIEAMKMENEINAHKAGTIATLSVTEGEPIKTGDPIATITSPPQTATSSAAPLGVDLDRALHVGVVDAVVGEGAGLGERDLLGLALGHVAGVEGALRLRGRRVRPVSLFVTDTLAPFFTSIAAGPKL